MVEVSIGVVGGGIGVVSVTEGPLEDHYSGVFRLRGG